MHLRISLLFTCAILFGLTIADEGKSGTNSGGAFWQSQKDEIFIDEEAIEGSGGGRGEVKDDLESSGSGFGPDDEDGELGSGAVDKVIPEDKKVEDPRESIVTKSRPVETLPSKPDTDDSSGSGTRTDEATGDNDVYIMNKKPEERATSFFAQPGILAAVIGGAVVGLLCAILVVMFIVYRMRKKDEGSYALDEPKRSPTVNSYAKNSNREFYA